MAKKDKFYEWDKFMESYKQTNNVTEAKQLYADKRKERLKPKPYCKKREQRYRQKLALEGKPNFWHRPVVIPDDFE